MASAVEVERLEHPGLDDDDVVGDALKLAEQVGGDDDGDPEVGADAGDEAEHLVAARGVEPVRRLVEEDELGVVDERLRELDALLHARGVAADRAVALLVEPDVAQRVRGALAGDVRGQAGHARHVDEELRGRDVEGEALALGHVAHDLADLEAVREAVEAEDARRPRGGRHEPKEDLDERGLARAVRADEADDARGQFHREVRDGDDGPEGSRQSRAC